MNEFGDEGAEYLANTLQTNRVSHILWSSTAFSPSLFNIDTNNNESWVQRNQK
jgi:hypothetical protein